MILAKGAGCGFVSYSDDEIERKVQKRTAHLEAANRELKCFVSAVSHDLRGPLRSILGFTNIVLEEHAGGMVADAVNCLEQVQQSATKMSGMLDGLLNLSLAGHEELVKMPVDIGRLAGEIVQRLRQEEPGRDVECVIQEPLIALGDKVLLSIVLENLLGNAWKFTGRAPRAKIELTGNAQGGCSVYSVNDNGVGFAASESGRLFKPFRRLHSQEEFPGVGLGLVTVRRIIGRHGGRIWAEGKIGVGAKFCFTL